MLVRSCRVGLSSVSLWFVVRLCRVSLWLVVSQCRVSEAGVASFLCYHPLLADLLFEDTVGALAIINTTDCPLLSLNMISCVATTGGPADTDNKVCFGFCSVQA